MDKSSVSSEIRQNFLISQKRKTSFYRIQATYAHPLLPATHSHVLTLLVFCLIWLQPSGGKHEGITGSWESQMRKCKTFSLWNALPSLTPIKWCHLPAMKIPSFVPRVPVG